MPEAEDTSDPVIVPTAPGCEKTSVSDFPLSPARADELVGEPDLKQESAQLPVVQSKDASAKSTAIETGNKAKRGAPPLPPNARSLTDEEYGEIFRAVLERMQQAQSVQDEDELQNDDDENGVPEAQEVNESTPMDDEGPQLKKKVKKTPPKIQHKKSFHSVKTKKNKLPPKEILSKNGRESKCKSGKGEKRKLPSEKSKHNMSGSQSKKAKLAKGGISKKQLMAEREIEEDGIWVQCSLKDCQKWRILKDVHDPSLIPNAWSCIMNSDPDQNCCDDPEAAYDPETELEDFIYTTYVEGSLVWARMAGFPWWPGMVEVDPDYDVYFECRDEPNIASHYHVVFMDKSVTRAWLSTTNTKAYTGEDDMGPTKIRGKNHSRALEIAKAQAMDALHLDLPSRIRMYGFAARYRGKWGQLPSTDKKAKAHSRKSSKRRPWEAESESDSFCGLSNEEVDEILESAESLIDSANEALSELLSQEQDDAYKFPESPLPHKQEKKKKAKKEVKSKKEPKPKEAKKPEGKGAVAQGAVAQGPIDGKLKKAAELMKKIHGQEKKAKLKPVVKKGSPPSSTFVPHKDNKVPPKKSQTPPRPTEGERKDPPKVKNIASATSTKKDTSKSPNKPTFATKKKFVAPKATKPSTRPDDDKKSIKDCNTTAKVNQDDGAGQKVVHSDCEKKVCFVSAKEVNTCSDKSAFCHCPNGSDGAENKSAFASAKDISYEEDTKSIFASAKEISAGEDKKSVFASAKDLSDGEENKSVFASAREISASPEAKEKYLEFVSAKIISTHTGIKKEEAKQEGEAEACQQTSDKDTTVDSKVPDDNEMEAEEGEKEEHENEKKEEENEMEAGEDEKKEAGNEKEAQENEMEAQEEENGMEAQEEENEMEAQEEENEVAEEESRDDSQIPGSPDSQASRSSMIGILVQRVLGTLQNSMDLDYDFEE